MPNPSLAPRRIGVAVTAVAMTLGAATLMPTAARAAGAPANDDFANAQVITGNTVTGSTVGATAQPGETMPEGYIASGTIWYSWTAPSSGPVLFDLRSNTSTGDSLLAVYTLSGKTLNVAAFNDDTSSSTRSAAPLVAIAGTTYYVQIGDWTGDAGWPTTLDIIPITTGLTGVVRTTGGAPVAGACVTDTAANSSYPPYSITNAAGQYVLAQPAGSDTPTASNCLGSANIAQATTPAAVTVTNGSVATADPITVTAGGTIVGQILNQNGTPMAGATIDASSGSAYGRSYADGTGHYTLSGLPTDTYSVEAVDATTHGSLFDKQVTGVSVSAGGTATVNMSVTEGAYISGTVTGPDGNPCAGTSSTPSASILAKSGSTTVTASVTSGDGSYSTTAPAGTYQVSFTTNTCGGTQTLWFNQTGLNQTVAPASAASITLAPGEILTGVSANFHTPGTPLPAPTAWAVDMDSAPFVSPVCVAAQKAAGASAAPIANAQAALAAANAKLAKDTATLKKLTTQLKKAKKHHASKSAIKKLTKKIKTLQHVIALDRAAVASATATLNAAVAAGGAAGAAVAADC